VQHVVASPESTCCTFQIGSISAEQTRHQNNNKSSMVDWSHLLGYVTVRGLPWCSGTSSDIRGASSEAACCKLTLLPLVQVRHRSYYIYTLLTVALDVTVTTARTTCSLQVPKIYKEYFVYSNKPLCKSRVHLIYLEARSAASKHLRVPLPLFSPKP
jgi:hypothetical protein